MKRIFFDVKASFGLQILVLICSFFLFFLLFWGVGTTIEFFWKEEEVSPIFTVVLSGFYGVMAFFLSSWLYATLFTSSTNEVLVDLLALRMPTKWPIFFSKWLPEAGLWTAFLFSLPLLSWGNELLIDNFPGAIGDFLRRSAQMQEQLLFLFADMSVGWTVVSILVIAVLTGCAEEIFFRGALQGLILRATDNPSISVIVTALIFVLAHQNFSTFLPMLFLAIMLGCLRQYSRSVWPGTVLHIVNNLIIILVYVFAV